jgi:hypothetical protein
MEAENELERPNAQSVTTGRIEVIDFLRGFAIVEMIASHFDWSYPLTITKLVNYTETAMALFVLLAGFMVGQHYSTVYLRDPRRATRRLWGRALQILVIQYIIIITVNAPLHLIGYNSVGRGEPLWFFMLKSAAFLNQIGIVHILPTFIPLFVVSPLILFLLKTKREWLLIVSSVGLFAVGNFKPHLLDLGQPAIFPFLVIQIYFVAGCMWGRAVYSRGTLGPRKLNRWLAASCAALATTMYLLHGKVVPGRLVSIHPLNVFGLLYQAPIIMTILLGTMRFWRVIRACPFYPWIALFGRHALLAFVLHLYCAKAIGVLNFYVAVPLFVNYTLILGSVAIAIVALRRYDTHDRQHPGRFVAALAALFK